MRNYKERSGKVNPKSAFFRSQLNIVKPFAAKCSLGIVRRTQDNIGKLMANSCKDHVNFKYVRLGHLDCAMLTPKELLSDGVVLYLHGGGYVAGNLEYACGFASVLATKCGVRVFSVGYRLAPEHPYPAALDDAMDAYGYLLSDGYDPSRIILCGESAGGGLCYAMCQKLRDKSRTMPAGIIAISPWTDLTLSSESYKLNKKNDPSMTEEMLRFYADCYAYGGTEDEKGRVIPKSNSDPLDDKACKNANKRKNHHKELDHPSCITGKLGDKVLLDSLADKRIGDSVSNKVCIKFIKHHSDTGEEECQRNDALTCSAAELIDEGLYCKGCCLATTSCLPLAILNRIRKEEEHKKLNKRLTEEETETCDNDNGKDLK